MTTLENLEIVIKANNEQAIKAINEVRDSVQGLGDSAQSSIGGSGMAGAMMVGNIASQVLMTTVTKLGQTFFDLGQAIVKNGTELSRIKVATNVVARNMGMTADQTNNLRRELEEANTYGVQAEEVIKTLAMSGLVDMANGLKVVDARTGEYKEGVAGLVLTMKDLSAAALVESAEGIDRITRFIRSGNASFVDGIIEVGNMNYAYREFAKTLNKDVQDLTEAERAQARLNMVQAEGQKAFGAYASTMQSAGKLWQSIQQKFTQITATIGEAMSPIFDTLANGIFQFVSAVQGGVSEATNDIRIFSVKVAGVIVAMFRGIGRLLSKIPYIGKNFEGLANFTMKPIKAIDTLTDSTNGLGGAMGDAGSSAKDLKKELAGLAGFDEMNVLKSGAGEGSGGLVGIGAGISDALQSSVDDFDATTLINDIASEISLGDWSAVDKVFEDKMGMSIGEFLAPGFILTKIDAIAKALTLPTSLQEQIRIMAGEAVAEVVGMSEDITNRLIWLDANGQSITADMADGMINNVKKIKDKSVNEIEKNVAEQIASLDYLKDEAGSITQEQYDKMVAEVKEGGKKQIKEQEDIATRIEKVITELKDSGVEVTAEMREGITRQVTQLRDNSVDIMIDDADTQLEVMRKLKNESGVITAEQVSSAIKNSILKRDATINNAQKEYDETIAKLNNLKNTSSTMTDAMYQDLKDKAINKKNSLIDTATAEHNGVVKEIEAMGGESTDAVNLSTGEMKSEWEMFWNNAGKAVTGAWDSVTFAVGGLMFDVGNELINGLNLIIDEINRKLREWQGYINWYNNNNGPFPDIGINLGQIANLKNLVKNAGQQSGAGTKKHIGGSAGWFAQGGIVSSPTLAMIGEAGREAVVPLENNTGWINELAGKINSQGGGMNLVVKLGEEKIYDRFIDFVNDKTLLSNETILNI